MTFVFVSHYIMVLEYEETHTTPIRFSSKSERNNVSTNCDPRTSTTSTRVYGEVVGATALPATSRKAFGVVIGAHIRPLTQGSLAEQ